MGTKRLKTAGQRIELAACKIARPCAASSACLQRPVQRARNETRADSVGVVA
jgi:hypothetical protein